MRTIFFAIGFLLPHLLNAQWENASTWGANTFADEAVTVTGVSPNGTVFVALALQTIFYSTDNGSTWNDPGITGIGDVSVFYSYGALFFAGTLQGQIYRSDDNGTHWAHPFATPSAEILSITASGNNLLYGSYGGGVSLSRDSGSSWSKIDSTLPNKYVRAVISNGTTIFVGTDGGIFSSVDTGRTWSLSASNTIAYALAISGNTIFAAGFASGIVRSTDNGAHWNAANSGMPANSVCSTVFVIGPKVLAGTNVGVFISADNGSVWTDFSQGLPEMSPLYNTIVRAFAMNTQYVFAGSDDSTPGSERGIWRRPLGQVVTEVSEVTHQVPLAFHLDQNFPNPFNSTTLIKFTVPRQSFVLLAVYDVLGQKVSTLVSQQLPPGTYSTRWDAVGQPSGVYFYRMYSADFTETKKLLLVR